MNKILVNDGKILEPGMVDGNMIISEDSNLFLELSEYSKNIEIEICENVRATIKIIGENVNLNIKVRLNNNSYVHIDNFLVNSNVSIVSLLVGRDSEIEFVNSMIVDKDSKLDYMVSHDNECTKSLVVNNGLVLNNNKLIFNVDGIVNSNSKRSICLQDSKIITNFSKSSTILPNLYIDNYDVEAEHSAYIGGFNSDDMFYLMSRGISREDAYLLLVKSFLMGKMNLTEEEENKIISIINKNVRKGD